MTLEELRFKLEENQQVFFEYWLERKTIIAKIQLLKDKAFDPVREREVFSEFKSFFKKFEIEELLSFSLLAQSHVRSCSTYPNWFEGDHLNIEPTYIFERINPQLLMVCRPDLFARLELKEEFQKPL